MRLTIHEQALIRCICSAQCLVTRHYLVAQTNLSFSTVDKCLGDLITSGQLIFQPDGGFALTKLAKCNPVVKLMLQEKVEERLWVEGNRRQQQYKLISRFRSIVYYYLQIPN